MTDPIIEDLHRLREEALAEVGFDYHAFCERLRERERRSPRVVEPPPRPATQVVAEREGETTLGSGSRR